MQSGRRQCSERGVLRSSSLASRLTYSQGNPLMPSAAYVPLKPSKEERLLQLPDPICQGQDPVGLCQEAQLEDKRRDLPVGWELPS